MGTPAAWQLSHTSSPASSSSGLASSSSASSGQPLHVEREHNIESQVISSLCWPKPNSCSALAGQQYPQSPHSATSSSVEPSRCVPDSSHAKPSVVNGQWPVWDWACSLPATCPTKIVSPPPLGQRIPLSFSSSLRSQYLAAQACEHRSTLSGPRSRE